MRCGEVAITHFSGPRIINGYIGSAKLVQIEIVPAFSAALPSTAKKPVIGSDLSWDFLEVGTNHAALKSRSKVSIAGHKVSWPDTDIELGYLGPGAMARCFRAVLTLNLVSVVLPLALVEFNIL